MRQWLPWDRSFPEAVSEQPKAAAQDLPAFMRDELPPVGQRHKRQRFGIVRIVDPHQTRMSKEARLLSYTDHLPYIGIRRTRLDEALPNGDRHTKPPNALGQ